MKKINFIILVLVFLISIPLKVSAADNKEQNDPDVPNGPVCLYTKSYTETIGSLTNDEQFRYLAEQNSVVTSVTRTVELTSSLTITGGYEGEINFLLKNSKVKFELSGTGTRKTLVTVTWENIPAYETHMLVAGKKIQAVTGKIHILNSDCSVSDSTLSVKGSIIDYHTSYRL